MFYRNLQTAKIMSEEWIKGRGAQYNSLNRFDKNKIVQEHFEGLDEEPVSGRKTQFIHVYPKTILNKVESKDIYDAYSMNAYQGCEHGCIYCYARVTHEYLGFSAGLDFESKIMIKKNVVELLDKALSAKNYVPKSIMLSGNTDCYQPVEKEQRLTRGMLEILLKHRHPVDIITKNVLVLRDLDILQEMARRHLVNVSISITSLNESLRLLMEPRTATYRKRIEVVRELSKAGIPVNVMIAPIVPSINDHEIPAVMEASAEAGALSAGFTMVRLNGTIGEIFTDWVRKAYPDRAEKVLNQIREAHGGNLFDHRAGVRMRGEGKIAESIRTLFTVSRRKYFKDRRLPDLDFSKFTRNANGQLSLFD